MAGLETEDDMSKPVGRPHQQWLLERPRDPGFAAECLTAAAEDAEPVAYLSALRNVAEARGMSKVAKAAGIPRKSLACIGLSRPRETRAGVCWPRSCTPRG